MKKKTVRQHTLKSISLTLYQGLRDDLLLSRLEVLCEASEGELWDEPSPPVATLADRRLALRRGLANRIELLLISSLGSGCEGLLSSSSRLKSTSLLDVSDGGQLLAIVGCGGPAEL
jgi:hypothetical protein